MALESLSSPLFVPYTVARLFRLLQIARTSAYFTFKATQKAKQFVRVTYDGQDWIHRWRTGAYVSTSPLKRPLLECSVSIPLFTYTYRPKDGDTIFDVGAGMGTELQAFSEMVGPTGRVIAIEADPTAFRCLGKLRQLLNLENVTLINSAVGDFEGTANFTQDALGALTNMLASTAVAGTIRVPVTTLDVLSKKLGLERIDYVKMNIEGAEVQALKGFVNRHGIVRNWCISCHDFHGTPECQTLAFVAKWLTDNGLNVTRHPSVSGMPWMGDYLFAS